MSGCCFIRFEADISETNKFTPTIIVTDRKISNSGFISGHRSAVHSRDCLTKKDLKLQKRMKFRISFICLIIINITLCTIFLEYGLGFYRIGARESAHLKPEGSLQLKKCYVIITVLSLKPQKDHFRVNG